MASRDLRRFPSRLFLVTFAVIASWLTHKLLLASPSRDLCADNKNACQKDVWNEIVQQGSGSGNTASYTWIKANETLLHDLKHRYDFGSSDSGARIVDYAHHLKNVKAVTHPSYENYMVTRCDQKAWFVMALPEQIYIETVGFHFVELFSSFYGKVAILGTTAYPTSQWRLLALLELDPTKTVELFDLVPFCSQLKSPACWVSHIKVQFLSYHPAGPAPSFCTLTRMQVFGSTVIQGLETKMRGATNDADVAASTSVEKGPAAADIFDDQGSGPENITPPLSRDATTESSPLYRQCPIQYPLLTSINDFYRDEIEDAEAFNATHTEEEPGAHRLLVERSRDVIVPAPGLELSDLRRRWPKPGDSPSKKGLVNHLLMQTENQPATLEWNLLKSTEKVAPRRSTFAASISPAVPAELHMRLIFLEQCLDANVLLEATENDLKEEMPGDPVEDVRSVAARMDLLGKELGRDIEEAVRSNITSTTKPSDGPPLLALVDRVTDIERLRAQESVAAVRRLAMLRDIVTTVVAAVDSLDRLGLGLELSLEKHLSGDAALEGLFSTHALTNLLRLSCQRVLEEYSWGNSNGKRSVCLLAGLLESHADQPFDSTALQSAIRSATQVNDLGFRLAVEYRLRKLQLLSAPDASVIDPSRMAYLQSVVNAGLLYRGHLRRFSSIYGLRTLWRCIRVMTQLAFDACRSFVRFLGHFVPRLQGENDLSIFSESWSGWSWPLASLVAHLEKDVLISCLEIVCLELTHLIDLWFLVKCCVFIIALDCFLRVRELEGILRLYVEQHEGNRVDTAVIDEVAEELGLLNKESLKFARPGFSAPPSAVKFTGGLSRALAHSLRPINRYWSPFRRRYRLSELIHRKRKCWSYSDDVKSADDTLSDSDLDMTDPAHVSGFQHVPLLSARRLTPCSTVMEKSPERRKSVVSRSA